MVSSLIDNWLRRLCMLPAVQAKRDRFLSLVREIVKSQQDISMGMVDLFQEREMSLER